MTRVVPGSGAYVEQVGGDHYKQAGDLQHWDLMEAHDISYLEATATKYLVRWDRKGKPVEDLKKARSYLEKIIANGRRVRRWVPLGALCAYAKADNLDQQKVAMLMLILAEDGGEMRQLRTVIEVIDTLIRREQGR